MESALVKINTAIAFVRTISEQLIMARVVPEPDINAICIVVFEFINLIHNIDALICLFLDNNKIY